MLRKTLPMLVSITLGAGMISCQPMPGTIAGASPQVAKLTLPANAHLLGYGGATLAVVIPNTAKSIYIVDEVKHEIISYVDVTNMRYTDKPVNVADLTPVTPEDKYSVYVADETAATQPAKSKK